VCLNEWAQVGVQRNSPDSRSTLWFGLLGFSSNPCDGFGDGYFPLTYPVQVAKPHVASTKRDCFSAAQCCVSHDEYEETKSRVDGNDEGADFFGGCCDDSFACGRVVHAWQGAGAFVDEAVADGSLHGGAHELVCPCPRGELTAFRGLSPPPLQQWVGDVTELEFSKGGQVSGQQLAVVLLGGLPKSFSRFGVGLGVDVVGAKLTEGHVASFWRFPSALFDCCLLLTQPPSGIRFSTEGGGGLVAFAIGAWVGGLALA